ncbi:MAG: DNA polymerase III subunit chi [Thiotrichales bacterium]|nr:MAG: DNA polymerase III subunit chi [Thiotrichales bacterium]
MKPRIDFYKLNGQNRTSINRFCCQLTDKVVKMGHSVFIRTKDAGEAQRMDDMLWTYSDSSFLPHAIQGDEDDFDVPVIIGHTDSGSTDYLLINMSDDIPENLDHYQRVAEIIDDTPDTLQKGRARYSSYRKEEYTLHYHEIA